MSGRPDGPSWSVVAATATAEGTRELAAALAPLARPGDVVLLVGGLGAGKTTFAQGFARGLGVVGPVTSPTFTLVRQYPCTGAVRQLLHADVYRLDTLAEVADLGLSELVEDGAVALVEWGDAAAPALGDDTLTVVLEPVDILPGADRSDAAAGGDDATEPDGQVGDEDARTVTVAGRGRRWADRRAAVTAALGPFGGCAHGEGGVAGPGAPEEPVGPGGADR